MQPIFITGIGTNVGKTIAAAILTEALEADYWKPVQAGYKDGTDSEWLKAVISNPVTKVYPETYKLHAAISPHIAARQEGRRIELDEIERNYKMILTSGEIGNKKSGIRNEELEMGDDPSGKRYLIIEGAGGLMAPLNEEEFAFDLIKKLDARLIIVSRNYLGSINHSLLTASICKSNNIPITGWIFNDEYLNYEDEILRWTGIPRITSIPSLAHPDRESIAKQARLLGPGIRKMLQMSEPGF